MRADDVRAVGRIERAVFGADAWPVAAFTYLVHVFRAAGPTRGRFWIAEDAGRRVVGYVGLELSALGGEADLVNLAVQPGHRRTGVGRRLVKAALAYCRRRRIALAWLRVRAANRGARALYRRCGFRVVGRFRDYYQHPREDAILMAVPLGSQRRERPRAGSPTRAR